MNSGQESQYESENRDLPGFIPTGNWRTDIGPILREYGKFEQEIDELRKDYSGLMDLDNIYRSVKMNFVIARELISYPVANTPDPSDIHDRMILAREHAQKGLFRLEKLMSSTLSVDQVPDLKDAPELEEIRLAFHGLIRSGGTVLFQGDEKTKGQKKRIISILQTAIEKFSRNTKKEMTLEEGEEDLLFSEYMTLPVTQAIHMIENELLPDLRKRLEASPGDPLLQKQIRFLEHKNQAYKMTKFIPKARPLIPEEGYDTQGFASYTSAGERLVTVKIPVIMDTGNRFDGLKAHVMAEVVKNSSVKGLSSQTKAAVKNNSDPANGGSWLNTDNLINIEDSFRNLGMEFPMLRKAGSEEIFKKLVQIAETGDKRTLRRELEDLSAKTINLLDDGRIRQLLE